MPKIQEDSSSRQDKRAECRQRPRDRRLVSPASRDKKDYRGFRGNGQRSVTMAVCFLAAATPFSFTGSRKYLRATAEDCIAQKTQFPQHRGTLLPLEENSISPRENLRTNAISFEFRSLLEKMLGYTCRIFDTPLRDSPKIRPP